MTQSQTVDMLVHVDQPEAKARLAARLAECPGVFESHINTPKDNLLFVSHDPARFDISSVVAIAKDLGIEARIVEI